MEVKYYICRHCGNIITKVKNSGVPVICCGEIMQEINANTVDASTEKHVPVVERNGNVVLVKIGSVEHPMINEHYIEWITLKTNQGIYRKHLKPGTKPEATFVLTDGEEVVEVFEYCNLHGLWKA